MKTHSTHVNATTGTFGLRPAPSLRHTHFLIRRWLSVLALLLFSVIPASAAVVANPAVAPSNLLDRFGGFIPIEREVAGFFRVEQVNGRWIFITPEGHGYLALGANHVGKFVQNQSAELMKRFDGDREKAGAALTQAIRDLGLNAGEAYAPYWPKRKTQMPWVANISYPYSGKSGKLQWRYRTFQFDVFDPAWQPKLRTHVLKQCREFATDPFVLGVAFVDQPLWGRARVEYFRNLPESAPGRQRLREHQQAGRSDEEFLALVADTLYAQLKAAVREGAPHHLFFGERFVLRQPPDAVLRAVGKHVDVFCTQALIPSRHRPPEWQAFQPDGWDHEYKLTGKPVLVIDWAAPFSLGEGFESQHGRLKTEADDAEDSAEWLSAALTHPGIVNVFRCQLVGTHVNDHWFEGRAKRTYLRDDGTPFPIMAARVSEANRAALEAAYEKAAGK
ncbi:MAG TPA: hypothetical protein VMY37_11820 [Thermoguttaceae bacterium]|nr:hypothetical protein [Thermoguttaceae bacterium]